MSRVTVRRTPSPQGRLGVLGYVLSAIISLALFGAPGLARADTDSVARGMAASAKLPATCTASASQASILACHAQLLATGGKIMLPAATITLTSSLPVDSNIWYVGVGPTGVGNTTDPGDLWTIVNGTVLQGDGTFPAFAGKITPLGSPDDGSTAIFGWGLEHVILNNFSYGVQVGALNSYGLLHSHMYDVWMSNITGWGFDIENFGFLDLQNIYLKTVSNCGKFIDSLPTATYNPANTYIRRLFCIPQVTNLARGFVFEANNNSNMGAIEGHQLQVNDFSNVVVTQAATMANASTTITVTDGTKFPVAMPVSFTSTANGFKQNQIYFVLTQSGNNLTLGNSRNGPAISATGNTAINITTQGFPQIEVVALQANGSSLITGVGLYELDLEGRSTCTMYIDNASDVRLNGGIAPIAIAHVCERTARFVDLHAGLTALTLDLDGNSTTSQTYGTVLGLTQRNGVGIYNNSTRGTTVLSLSGRDSGGTPDIESRPLSGASYLATPNAALGQRSNTSATTSGTLDASSAGLFLYNGAADGTRPLPTIVNSSVAASNIGIPYWFINESTHLLTITSDVNQTFNGVTGKNTLLLQPGQMLLTWAVVDGGGNFRWATIVSRDLMASSAAPSIAGCGTGATIAGSDGSGTVVAGTGPTSCVVTFTNTRPSAPHCNVTDEAGSVPAYSETTTALTITPTASHTYDYQCAA